MYKPGRIKGIPCIVEAMEVTSEAEERNAVSMGFVAGGQQAAMDHLHAMDREIAELAANRAYTDRRMTAQAQAEAAAIDDATPDHLPVLPEQPKPRRGRPPFSKLSTSS